KAYVDKVGTSIVVYDDDGEEQPGGNTISTLLTMTWDDKRALVESVFRGALTAEGKPGGVYVTPDGKGGFNYTMIGRLTFAHDKRMPRSTGAPSSSVEGTLRGWRGGGRR